MFIEVKPGQAFTALAASVFFHLTSQILFNAVIFYVLQVRNYISVIANAVDNWSPAEFFQPFTRKLRTRTATGDLMHCSTFPETVFTHLADIPNKIGQTPMALIGKCRTSSTVKSANRYAFFVWLHLYHSGIMYI